MMTLNDWLVVLFCTALVFTFGLAVGFAIGRETATDGERTMGP